MNLVGLPRLVKNNMYKGINNEIAVAEPKRRSFLKFLALGSGVAVVGGVLGSLKLDTRNPSSVKDTLFSKLRITENNKEISFRTKAGDELLIIEKAG